MAILLHGEGSEDFLQMFTMFVIIVFIGSLPECPEGNMKKMGTNRPFHLLIAE
jgi:hypothetical protein